MTPVGVSDLYELLGKKYTKHQFAATDVLLNMELDAPMPILDSINFEYYNSYALKFILDKDPRFTLGGSDNKDYLVFRKAFKEAKNNVERRKILYDSMDNAIFLDALEASKYTTFNKPISVKITTSIANALKLGITAKINAQLKEGTEGKIDVKTENAIKDSIHKYIQIEGCNYHEIKLQEQYVLKAGKILRTYANDPSKLDKFSDDFSYQFGKFLNEPCDAIVTGAAVLEAKFNYEKFSKLRLAIGAVLTGNLGLSETDKNKITADITANYTKQKTVTQEINTAQTFYYIRYTFNKDLELGAGDCK
ncbi:hypothetical protein AB3466_11150 [Sphingobacterium thalpophilum]|uniref:hypothetical protein n=1 Tax=Sphingobacterium thalpophilum TaxID=259 RepID=UPI0037DA5EA6